MSFVNDWHTIMNFGPYKGKQLLDIPTTWLKDNVKYGPIYETVIRIDNRKSVTNLIRNRPVDSYIPLLTLSNTIPNINRPKTVDPALFGSFVEFFVKYRLGLRKNDEILVYLATHGLVTLPSHLRFHGDIIKPDKRTKYIYKSFLKDLYLPSDICNLSFVHSLNLNSFNEELGSELYNFVVKNEQYFIEYENKIYITKIIR